MEETDAGKAMTVMTKPVPGKQFLTCSYPLWGALSRAWASILCENAPASHDLHMWINMDQMFTPPSGGKPELGISFVQQEAPIIAACAKVT